MINFVFIIENRKIYFSIKLRLNTTNSVGAKDYRTILRLYFLFKALERRIDLYLRSNIDRYLLSRSQHAYIKGKSDQNALHDATGFVQANFARGEYTLLVFLDDVTTSSIENSLSYIHASDFLVQFITYMVGNRLICSNLG